MELYDIDERSADDERDLEKPVKYGSGAELEFDKKAQKFYDRGRDIYLDDEEAEALIKETVRKTLSSNKKVKAIKESAAYVVGAGPMKGARGTFSHLENGMAMLKLTVAERDFGNVGDFITVHPDSLMRDKEIATEGIPSSMRTTYSSDPEMDQVMDIAADMLELGARSRIPVSLVGVEMALEKQGFDTKMEKGKLIVDDKYVIAAKDSLPDTAQKISFTKYAADYLSNLSGEQQDLPMDEQERPDFVTSYSSDPHLDQIEDYALTVIEKGGNLRQLEDVLNRDGFATFLNGDVLIIDDEFFVGNEENFDISPNEDIRRVGPYVVGYNK